MIQTAWHLVLCTIEPYDPHPRDTLLSEFDYVCNNFAIESNTLLTAGDPNENGIIYRHMYDLSIGWHNHQQDLCSGRPREGRMSESTHSNPHN